MLVPGNIPTSSAKQNLLAKLLNGEDVLRKNTTASFTVERITQSSF